MNWLLFVVAPVGSPHHIVGKVTGITPRWRNPRSQECAQNRQITGICQPSLRRRRGWHLAGTWLALGWHKIDQT